MYTNFILSRNQVVFQTYYLPEMAVMNYSVAIHSDIEDF